jgi:hypothetical protein
MDTTPSHTHENDHLDDGSEGEIQERRHRRDFVGTELERPKKGSRQRNRKRHRVGLDLTEDHNMGQSNGMLADESTERTSLELALELLDHF